MIAIALASLALYAPSQLEPPPLEEAALGSPRPPNPQDDRKEEFERRRKAAGEDVDALWDLFLWCDAYGMEREGRKCLLAIVRVDENHEDARTRLGHIHYDGRWFTSERKLEEYKKQEAERIAKEKGLVRYEGEWVPADDVPFLERGLVRDDDGRWVTREEYEKLTQGWKRQDLVWIPPDEVENIAKGLWKCGDEWLELAAADRYHSETGRWWVIPGEHYHLYTTRERATAQKALELMELAYRDMKRLFGLEPQRALPMVLLRDTGQYGRFAAGEEGGRASTELRPHSSLHHAYLADAWIEEASGKLLGAGVAFWDSSSEEGDRWGSLATRHAAALSYVEGIDPSPKTAAKVEKSGGFDGRDAEEFWSEKLLPHWLRHGAASYAERYFVDSAVATDGDPFWPRKWSVANLKSRGGLRPLGQVFEAELTIDDREGSEKLLNELGLVVAFVLDGGCEPVEKAHARLKESLTSDAVKKKDVERAVAGLREEIEKHEAELRTFAGL